jgi:hypothetical protein
MCITCPAFLLSSRPVGPDTDLSKHVNSPPVSHVMQTGGKR